MHIVKGGDTSVTLKGEHTPPSPHVPPHCFPSTHVSLTVIILAVCWLFQVRFRNTVTALGITVILSTFVLGIHWLPDIVAGMVVGVLSVAIAWRFTDTSERRELALGPA